MKDLIKELSEMRAVSGFEHRINREIQEMLLPYCKYAHVTKINYNYAADTFFPNLDKLENWKLVGESDEHTYFSVEYFFYKYENTSPLEI